MKTKTTIKKEKVIKEDKKPVQLTSFTVKATIATGAYSNICPEITVYSETIEEARSYCMPIIEDMFKQYTGYLENKVEIKPSVKITQTITPINVVTNKKEPEMNITIKEETEAFKAAEKTIASCYSLEALKLIEDRIAKSTKLTEKEKLALNFNLIAKSTEISCNNK